jgi:hypothetical protein
VVDDEDQPGRDNADRWIGLSMNIDPQDPVAMPWVGDQDLAGEGLIRWVGRKLERVSVGADHQLRITHVIPLSHGWPPDLEERQIGRQLWDLARRKSLLDRVHEDLAGFIRRVSHPVKEVA